MAARGTVYDHSRGCSFSSIGILVKSFVGSARFVNIYDFRLLLSPTRRPFKKKEKQF